MRQHEKQEGTSSTPHYHASETQPGSTASLASSIQKGSLRRIALYEGEWVLWILDATLSESVTVPHFGHSENYELWYSISDNACFSLNEEPEQGKVLFASNSITKRATLPAREPLRIGIIEISENWLNRFFTDAQTADNERINLAADTSLMLSVPTVDIRSDKLWQQLFEGTMPTRELSTLYHFNIATELCLLFFEQLFNNERNITHIHPDDLHQIQKIRNLLVADLRSAPPELHILARQAGMGVTKFKQLFKEVFGVPPYHYYQIARLESAKELLLSDKYSITEVAYRVGYKHAGKFSETFKQETGLTPSQFVGARRGVRAR